MVHLSKLCCYSNRWLWVRLNFVDVLKMETYPLVSFFLFLCQKLTIVEQSCTLQGHFSLTSCHYRGIHQEYIRVWGVCQFLLYFCLINFGEKSCLFGEVTYVTALIWTYIPYMIHQSYHHTPMTYIDST